MNGSASPGSRIAIACLTISALGGTALADERVASGPRDGMSFERPGDRTVGNVKLSVRQVSSDEGSYAIEITAEAQGVDVQGYLAARNCTLKTPLGATARAEYVRIGESSGRSASANLLGGYEVPVTVRWSLNDPTLTKLLRVQLQLKLDGKWHKLDYYEIDVPRAEGSGPAPVSSRPASPLAPSPVQTTAPAPVVPAPAVPDPAVPAEPERPGDRTVGNVELSIRQVSSDEGSYAIEMTATAQGVDVQGYVAAQNCTLKTPLGATVKAEYVRLGEASGRSAASSLLGGYAVPVTIRWSLNDPTLTKLLRVQLMFKLDNRWHKLDYFEIDVPPPASAVASEPSAAPLEEPSGVSKMQQSRDPARSPEPAALPAPRAQPGADPGARRAGTPAPRPDRPIDRRAEASQLLSAGRACDAAALLEECANAGNRSCADMLRYARAQCR